MKNGIDVQEPESDARDYLLREFHLPDDAVVTVSVGRANEVKQIDTIIYAVQRVLSKRPDINLYHLHCGDGPELENLQRLTKEQQLEERILLPGRRNHIHALLPGCDLAIHAAKVETFGLVIIECMAAGLPVITPANCNNSGAIGHGVNGFLYTPGEPGELVKYLIECLASPELCRTLGKNGAKTGTRAIFRGTCETRAGGSYTAGDGQRCRGCRVKNLRGSY